MTQSTTMEDRQLLESRVMPVLMTPGTNLARMAVFAATNGPLTATRLLGALATTAVAEDLRGVAVWENMIPTCIGNNRSITPFVTRGTLEATCFCMSRETLTDMSIRESSHQGDRELRIAKIPLNLPPSVKPAELP